MPALSNRDLISNCDNFPDPATDAAQHAAWLKEEFCVVEWADGDDDEKTYPIGYMPRAVLAALVRIPAADLDAMGLDAAGVEGLQAAAAAAGSGAGAVVPLHRLLRRQRSEPARTRAVGALAAYWRARAAFGVLQAWRDELWPVYGRGGATGGEEEDVGLDDAELLFSVERAAAGLLGVVRYGVHMTAYVEGGAGPGGMSIWVPRRAADKPTYPGLLDNTVAGGLMTGERPFACLLREADEEASLPAAVLARRAAAAGVVTYVHVTARARGGGGDERVRYVHPECEWVFDLPLPADVVPRPQDGEVESFSLCTVGEVRAALARGEFKPNCAAVLLDFLARHGLLGHDGDGGDDEAAADRAAIARQLHRRLPFPGPHGAAAAAAAAEAEVRQHRDALNE